MPAFELVKGKSVKETAVFKTINRYDELRRRVSETIKRGRIRVRKALVETYWKVGKLIDRHLKKYSPNGELDRSTVLSLAQDVEMGRGDLFLSLKLARVYPKVPPAGLSSLSHYEALLSLKDNRERDRLIRQAKELGWNRGQLRTQIKKLGAAKHPAKVSQRKNSTPLTMPSLGPLYTAQVAGADKVPSADKECWIDFGFSVYRRAFETDSKNWKPGDLVSIQNSDAESESFSFRRIPDSEIKKVGTRENLLYTYRAFLIKVVDGDTLLVSVDLGFGLRTRQYLRLRSVDAPEIETRAGKKARDFVEKELAGVPDITIKSSRSDKFDRYLADVFYKNGLYLNQNLLDRAFAQRV